jgi:hypothetical protein
VAAAGVDVALLLFCCGLVTLFNVPAAGSAWRFGLGALFVVGLVVCGFLANSVAVYL